MPSNIRQSGLALVSLFLHLSCLCEAVSLLLNPVRLRGDSVFSMIACPMDGDFLFWIDTCNKRESILAHLLYWIVLPWWDRQDAEHWSFVLIIA